jgi:hypothetical protein
MSLTTEQNRAKPQDAPVIPSPRQANRRRAAYPRVRSRYLGRLHKARRAEVSAGHAEHLEDLEFGWRARRCAMHESSHLEIREKRK